MQRGTGQSSFSPKISKCTTAASQIQTLWIDKSDVKTLKLKPSNHSKEYNRLCGNFHHNTLLLKLDNNVLCLHLADECKGIACSKWSFAKRKQQLSHMLNGTLSTRKSLL